LTLLWDFQQFDRRAAEQAPLYRIQASLFCRAELAPLGLSRNPIEGQRSPQDAIAARVALQEGAIFLMRCRAIP
jgi:hypothetical protein